MATRPAAKPLSRLALWAVVLGWCLGLGWTAGRAITAQAASGSTCKTTGPTPTTSPCPSPTPSPGRVVIHPFEGPVGTRILAYGSHFKRGQRVTLYWDDPSHPLVQVTADSGGSFTAAFKAPTSPSGNHSVCIAQPVLAACDVFQLLAPPTPTVLTLEPSSAAPGSLVRASGGGFPAGVALTLSLEGAKTPEATLKAAADGGASATFKVPDLPPGPREVCLRGGQKPVCTTLTVTAPATTLAGAPRAPLAQSSSAPWPLYPLLVVALAVLVGGGAYRLLSHRHSVPSARVEHRVGASRLPSTHPEFWQALQDPPPLPQEPSSGADGSSEESGAPRP